MRSSLALQNFLDLGPILRSTGEQAAAALLVGDGGTPLSPIDQALDFVADQINNHRGRKRIQLPALIGAEAVAIAAGTGVGLFHEIRRRGDRILTPESEILNSDS